MANDGAGSRHPQRSCSRLKRAALQVLQDFWPRLPSLRPRRAVRPRPSSFCRGLVRPIDRRRRCAFISESSATRRRAGTAGATSGPPGRICQLSRPRSARLCRGWDPGHAGRLEPRRPDWARGRAHRAGGGADGDHARQPVRGALGDQRRRPLATADRRRLPLADAGATKSARCAAALPCTSIYSRADGVVAWPACLQPEGPQSENVEVGGSHFGLGFNAAALWVIADRLAQPLGTWTPFRPRGPVASFFPRRRNAKTSEVLRDLHGDH